MKTVKAILLLTIFISTATALYSQSVENIGIKVGVTMSNVRMRQTSPATNLFGQTPVANLFQKSNVVNPSVAVFVNVFNSCEFILQTELTYLRSGGSQTYEGVFSTSDDPQAPGTRASITSEIGLQYLVISIAAQPRLDLNHITVYADVRPTLGYLLRCSNLLDIGHQLSRFQAGYSLGIGCDLSRLLGGGLFLELAYAGDFRYFYDYGYARLWSRSWSCRIGTTL
jgi:hypothetical protein